jgi:hypothetical protein
VRALRDAQAQARKNTKSALTTCMRKLQIIANAIFRKKTSWQAPALAVSTATFSALNRRGS